MNNDHVHPLFAAILNDWAALAKIEADEFDPTRWCNCCGSRLRADCKCLPSEQNS